MLSLMIDGNGKALIPAKNCNISIYMRFSDGVHRYGGDVNPSQIDFAQSNSRVHSTRTYIFPVSASRTSEVFKPQALCVSKHIT